MKIKAGDAGNGAGAKTGSQGGDVRSVRISEIDDATILRSIAAGNGGSSSGTGGTGGSVVDLRVLGHDIGVRSGETFGYDTMGGIFAGTGGAGSSTGKAGVVTDVFAQAIAAIVAGRNATPGLVERVERIAIGTPQSTGLPIQNLLDAREGDLDLAETTGDPVYRAFIQEAYDSNNLVGAVVDPVRVDASKFRFADENGVEVTTRAYNPATDRPIDGLIAAKVLNRGTLNFAPEAYVEGSQFFDYANNSPSTPPAPPVAP